MYLFHIFDIDVVRVPVPAMMAIVHLVIAMMGQGFIFMDLVAIFIFRLLFVRVFFMVSVILNGGSI